MRGVDEEPFLGAAADVDRDVGHPGARVVQPEEPAGRHRLEVLPGGVERQQLREAHAERLVRFAPIERHRLLVGDRLQLGALAHRLAGLHPVNEPLDRNVELVGPAGDEDAVPVDDLRRARRVGGQAKARRVSKMREAQDDGELGADGAPQPGGLGGRRLVARGAAGPREVSPGAARAAAAPAARRRRTFRRARGDPSRGRARNGEARGDVVARRWEHRHRLQARRRVGANARGAAAVPATKAASRSERPTRRGAMCMLFSLCGCRSGRCCATIGCRTKCKRRTIVVRWRRRAAPGYPRRD